MRILMVTHHWPPRTHHSVYSGYERIAHYMRELCDVEVLTWGKKGRGEKSEVETKWVWTPSSDIFLERRLMLSISAALNAQDYDLVHSLYSVPGAFPSLKKRTIATVHIVPEISPDNLWLKYKGLWQKRVLARCSGVIAVSNNLLDVMKEKYRTNRVLFIPHGVDTNHFRPIEEETDFFANTRKGDELICLTIGAHGADTSDVYRLAKKFESIRFYMVGSSPAAGEKPGNVEFSKRLGEDEMLRAYNSADIFFRPLDFATANNSILEAMAIGNAIITDRIPGITDYLDDDTAFLVDGKEYESSFRQALENGAEREDKGRRAREKARAEYDWTVVARETKRFYDEVLGAT